MGKTRDMLTRWVACLGMAVVTTAAALADDRPNFIDPNGLVLFEDGVYHVSVEDWVSLEPTSSHTVKKIGYGRVTTVGIATTTTGTYSTDGLTSPHIRYPGIEVEPVHPSWIGGRWNHGGITGTFVPGRGLVSFRAPLVSGASFIHIVGANGGKLVSTPQMSCYSTRSFTVC